MSYLDGLSQEVSRLDGTNRVDYLKDFVKMPQGEGFIVVRLLPPHPENNTIYVSVRNHTVNDKRVPCSKELQGGIWRGDCPICTHYNALWKQSDNKNLSEKQVEELQNTARAIKPIERYFYNAIARKQLNDKGEVEYNVGPLILSVGKELHAFIIKSIVGNETLGKKGLGDVTNETTGRDLNLVKTLKGEYPSYLESTWNDVSPLHKDKKVVKEWLDNLHDLKARRKVKSFEELLHEVNVFRGLETDTSETFHKEDYDKQPAATTVKTDKVAAVNKTVAVDADVSLVEDDFLKDFDVDNL